MASKRDKDTIGELIAVTEATSADLQHVKETVTASNTEILALSESMLQTAIGAVALARDMHAKMEWVKGSEVLSPAELERFAADFPDWKVTSGIDDGKAFKRYERTIPWNQQTRELRNSLKFRLALTDPEHSDWGLYDIFGHERFTGDNMNGKYYVVGANAQNAGPLNYDDCELVARAEAYLVEHHYILPPKSEQTVA